MQTPKHTPEYIEYTGFSGNQCREKITKQYTYNGITFAEIRPILGMGVAPTIYYWHNNQWHIAECERLSKKELPRLFDNVMKN